MNIKSLLLGSAAALVAVSGARAADAIVAAEPEPVEYVRVCDAFGNGFFYIPGTETCLRISGFVRFQVGATRGVNGYQQNTRARINFDAREETELGTLQGFVRFQSDGGGVNADANTVTDQAVIRLGGLFMGYTESAWAALYGGAAGNWGLIPTDNGGSYGYQQRNQIGYRYDGGAFTAALVLENDAVNTNWTPDVVGVLSVTQGSVSGTVRLGYDESAKAFGVKAAASFSIPSTGGNLTVGGFYSNKAVNAYSAAIAAGEAANWSIGVGYSQAVSSNLSAALGYQYLDGFSAANGGTIQYRHIFEAAVVWNPVNNLSVRLEGHFGSQKTNAGVSSTMADGFLRVQRDF